MIQGIFTQGRPPKSRNMNVKKSFGETEDDKVNNKNHHQSLLYHGVQKAKENRV